MKREREKETEKEGGREREKESEKEGERVACTPKYACPSRKCGHALSVPHSVSQSACMIITGNSKGGSITVLLTSCLTGLDESVLQIKAKQNQLSHS
jgi:hypothetical protein